MIAIRKWTFRLLLLSASVLPRAALASGGDEVQGIFAFIGCLLASIPTAPDLCAAVEGCMAYMSVGIW